MDSENGNKILGIWISIFLDFGFWRDFGFSPQEFKLQIQKLIASGYVIFIVYLLSRVLDSTIGIRLRHYRYGYSLLGAYELHTKRLKYWGNEPFGISRLLGRGSFLSPGRTYS